MQDKKLVATLDVYAALERVNSAIAGATSSDALMSSVLDELLNIFSCERAWLVYPCTLEAESFQVPMERTRPEFPGAGATGEEIPINDYARTVIRKSLGSQDPVSLHLDDEDAEFLRATQDRFQIQSLLMMAIHPKGDRPWALGIHHCLVDYDYSEVTDLFQAIGRRVADGISGLIQTRQLRQSEQRFRTLFEHAPEAIVILDCESMLFADANPNAEALFGLPHEVLLTTSPMALSPELQSDGSRSDTSARGYIEAALTGNYPIFQWDHVHADGTVIPCEVRLAQLPHPSRTLLRGSVTNITVRVQAAEERRELEARLAQSQKMEAIGNLTGGIAHDFNNLLTVVIGNLDLLVLDPGNAEFVVEQAAQIRAAAERASSLTHRLLAFARRQPLRPTVVDAGLLLRGMEDLLRRSLGETIDIELVIAGGLWQCEVDETELENAILNLAINARDAIPDAGTLTIAASNTHLDVAYAQDHDDVLPGEYVLISVSDTGMGIPADALEKIFAPFYTTKEVGKGSGLGLSMVYGFVKQSGGHIGVDSEMGVGTSMKIYLPRARGAAVAPKHESAVPPDSNGNGEWVLLVEDEESVRDMTRRLLVTLGYRTHEAGTASEALELLAKHPEIQLLLTDVVLAGGMNGAELVRLACEQRRDLKVLFMSGYSEEAISQDGRLAADVSLLSKPFTKRALAAHVRAALDAD